MLRRTTVATKVPRGQCTLRAWAGSWREDAAPALFMTLAVRVANSNAFRGRAGGSNASRKEGTRRAGQPCPQATHPTPWEDSVPEQCPPAYLWLCCHPR